MARRISNRRYPEMECANPECKILFEPHDRRQIYCEEQCRVNHHNDKRHKANNTLFADERQARVNNKILKTIWNKIINQKKKLVAKSTLQWEGFRFDSQMLITKNSQTGRSILWYYDYGLELIDNATGFFEIHKKS